MSGYIKLYRGITDNSIWNKEPFSAGQAWIDLLLAANFKDKTIYIRKTKIEVKRGQIAWSMLTMAKRWKWSRGKVIRFLKDLENEQMIVQHTGHLTTLLTVCNYEKYQAFDTADGTTDSTADGTAGSTTGGTQHNKVNKGKKEKNNYTDDFEKFWTAYPRKEKKAEAVKVFAKIAPDQELLDRMISDVQARARTEDWTKDGGKFIPHPTTYLNQRRWEDETPKLRGIDGGKKRDGAVRDDKGEIKGWWMFGGTEFVENPEYRRAS